MFAVFFYNVLKNKIAKYIILSSIIPFWIFSIYIYLTTDSKIFNSNPILLHFLIFIIVLLFYFLEKVRNITITPLHKSIEFWLCVGLFIYFTGNFFYLVFLNSTKDVKLIGQMKLVNTIVTFTKDIILALAWLAHERTETDADIIKFPNGLGLDDDLPFTKPNHA